MPTSELSNIAPIINKVCGLRPRTVLDLGIGMGKMGALIREYLDATIHEAFTPLSWRTSITGVEGFEKYRNPMWGCYTSVLIEDFSDHQNWVDYTHFDLVLLLDSLEHIERAHGEELLRFLRKNNRNVIVSCPDGDFPQGAWGGNEYERHRSVWRKQDFLARGAAVIHKDICTVAHFKGEL